MLDAHLILTTGLYSLMVAVNMVAFWFSPPILLNKLVLCRCRVIIAGFCVATWVEAWIWGNRISKALKLPRGGQGDQGRISKEPQAWLFEG